MESCDESLLPLVIHLDQLCICLKRCNGHSIAVAVIAVVVNVTTEFLNLQVIEALVHQQVDADHFVELVHAQTSNCLENAEENGTENDAPCNDDDAAEALGLYHREAACIDQAKIFVKDADR